MGGHHGRPGRWCRFGAGTSARCRRDAQRQYGGYCATHGAEWRREQAEARTQPMVRDHEATLGHPTPSACHRCGRDLAAHALGVRVNA